MEPQYPSFNDREFDLLKKTTRNTAIIADNGGGGGGGVTSIIAGTGISVDQSTGAVTITNTGSGAVSSVFARTGDVVADVSDYSSFYAQLSASNSFSGVNTFSGAFIFTPATITIAANAGTIDITKVHSSATNGANTTLTPSAAGTLGQQICVIFVNSDTAAHTITGAGSAAGISYTAAASSTTVAYWKSNGSVWSVVGGAPTINDLGSITIASSDLLSVWDVSAGVTGKGTVASAVSAALTATPATVAQGGTGLATLTSGSLLVGAGTSNVTFIAPGTGIATWLATPSSANLAAAITDETGTGSLVFGTAPTLTNPIHAMSNLPSVDDTYTGTTITGLNNTGGVTQWDAVYLNSSSQWVLADANGTNTYPARGLAVATVSTGNATTVLVQGVVRNDAWTWTPGGTIYLSTTAGSWTQTAPSTSGDKVQAIGFALTADSAFFRFDPTYVTVT